MTESSATKTGAGGSRRIGSLLSSNAKMAVVGMLASVATIGFVLWIQYIMARQQKVGQPLMRGSLRLEQLLDRTFVELRGWIAYGDMGAKRARAKLWDEDIGPLLVRLEAAALSQQAETNPADFKALHEHLRRLRYLQWTVEDAARSASNEPARALYLEELAPLAEEAQIRLTAATRAGAHPPVFPTDVSADLTAELSLDAQRLLSALVAADRSVLALLRAGTPALAGQCRTHAERVRAQSAQIIERWGGRVPEALAIEALVEGADTARAYARRVPTVVRGRTDGHWNVAQTLYDKQLRPLQLEINALANKISNEQLQYVDGQAQGLFRWSFVVLALALLMGALSVAALYVSYRLEYRVQRALAKTSSLGKYIIEDRIGAGAMGDVFRARHALLRRPAAVKVLRLDRAFDVVAQERFQKEVRLTSNLNHPHTIAIFDYGRTQEGLFYYAMELLDGVALDVLVAVSGPLPPSRVVHVLSRVCSSLTEAHEQGLLHRDIKPSNVMLADMGGVLDWVKVLDFGLVTHIRGPVRATAKTAVVGTPAYLAPEAIRTGEAVGPRTDLYAVGALGYFLLTGRDVFEDGGTPEVLAAHLNDLPQPPSVKLGVELPEDLELLILACLAKDPGDRPRSAAELMAMLERIDVPRWQADDARLWWDAYGETVKAAARARAAADVSGELGVRLEAIRTTRASTG